MPFGHQSRGSSTRSTTSPSSSTVPKPSSSLTSRPDRRRRVQDAPAARCPGGSSAGRSPSRSPCGSCATGPGSSGPTCGSLSGAAWTTTASACSPSSSLDLERRERTLVLRDLLAVDEHARGHGRHPRTGSRRDPPPRGDRPTPAPAPTREAGCCARDTGRAPHRPATDRRSRCPVRAPGTSRVRPTASRGASATRRRGNPRSCQSVSSVSATRAGLSRHVLGRVRQDEERLDLVGAELGLDRQAHEAAARSVACAGRPADS